MRLPFNVTHDSEMKAGKTSARVGSLKTRKNTLETPVFMPVGTRGSVRAQTFETLEALDPPIILANTYHLFLRPGLEDFKKIGGIHKLTGWKSSVLTDSGGFQIFSLPAYRQISEKGALFESHIDKTRFVLTPETSIEMQSAIDSDIMMALDVCVPSKVEHSLAKDAMERTHRWAKRSIDARTHDSSQALFGIVQGALFNDLRRQSAETIATLKCSRGSSFDGIAIGGLAVGDEKSEREDTIEFVTQFLPHSRPRYLMGVGTPLDILESVHRGIDMFDCVLPTSMAQQGVIFTWNGKTDIRKGVYKLQTDEPIDSDCRCQTCARYSRAFLHHLVRSKEVLGWTAIGTHNLYFYLELMHKIRGAIKEGVFHQFYEKHRLQLANRF